MMKTAMVALATLIAAPVEARWRVAESPHFEVYSEASAADLQQFATTLERYDATLRLLSGAPDRAGGPAARVTVFQVPDLAAIRRLTGGPQSMVAGFYIPRSGGSIAFVPAKDAGGGWYDSGPVLTSRAILLHEYAHHFMFFNTPGGYPRWYGEGFAEFAAATQFAKDGAVTIGGGAMYRAGGLTRGAVSASEIVTTDGPTTAIDQDAFYAWSWALTHYLTFAPERKGQLDAYLRAVTAGQPRTRAAAAFGDLGKLDRDLRAYATNRQIPGLRLAANLVPIGTVSVRELSDGENAMVPVRIVSWRGVDDRQAAALVPQAEAVAARYPADVAVQTALAEAEYDAKRYAEARAAADRALKADPKAVRALLYRGRTEVAMATAAKAGAGDPAWAGARRWFAEAARIDPLDPEPLRAIYHSYAAQGAPLPREAAFGLQRAAMLAPQDQSLQIEAASQSLAEGDVPAARSRLRLIRTSAHAKAAARMATLWTALDAGDAKGALAALHSSDASDGPAKPGASPQ